MAVVLSYWKHTKPIWKIVKFAHKIFSQIQKLHTKIFGYIINIIISRFIIFRTINIRKKNAQISGRKILRSSIILKVSQCSQSVCFQSKPFSLYRLVVVPHSLLPYSHLYQHTSKTFWIFWKAYPSHLFFPRFQH